MGANALVVVFAPFIIFVVQLLNSPDGVAVSKLAYEDESTFLPLQFCHALP
jgi:hypothetical protein